MSPELKRYVVVTCAILYREVCHCVAKSKNIVDIVVHEKGLHDLQSTKMTGILQETIDKIDHSKYDAILLCYGLCNNGLTNLHAPITMVLPRAHDCIALLLGSRKIYDEYFFDNPGTYFNSSGWLERNISTVDDEETIPQQLGMDKSYESFVEEYGEENAEYLHSILGNWLSNYKKVAFINNGMGDVEGNRLASQAFAKERDWEYEEVPGSICLIEQLINGSMSSWDENDFLIIPPGKKIAATHDESIVTCL